MTIKWIRVSNYKSFSNSERMILDNKMNIFVGKNNSGKTAFLEALSLNFTDNPHMSLDVKPNFNSYIEKESSVELNVSVSSQEIKEIFNEDYRNKRLVIKSSLEDTPPGQLRSISDQLEMLLQTDINLMVKLRGDIKKESIQIKGFSHSFEAFPFSHSSGKLYQFYYEDEKAKNVNKDSDSYSGNEVISNIIFENFRKSVYKFNALRQNIGSCEIKDSKNGLLDPDASNLPAVLLLLGNNPVKYNEYVRYVKQVFPGIEDIRPNIVDGTSKTEIRVWTQPILLKRDDLTIPLIECGTGISQVLAILYVVTTNETSKTIIIDEPQSFLHSDAIRRLLRVFRDHPQHQYIIATHSPIIINNLASNKTFLIRLEGQKSTIESIEASDASQMSKILDEIGASISDILGYEKILWVEGPTEEKSFPEIIERIDPELALKVKVLGVKNTGDFDKKSIQLTLDVYKKLCNGIGLIPPAVGFIFDRESKSNPEIQDLVRQSGGLIHFLRRKLFENYLLEPQAIANVLNELIKNYYPDSDKEKTVSALSIQSCLNAKIWEFKERAENGNPIKVYKYFDKSEKEAMLSWFKERGEPCENIDFEKIKESPNALTFYERFVHGAKLLRDLFADLTDYKIEYSKTRDSVALTNEILKKSPEKLAEIQELIQNLLLHHREKGVKTNVE